MNDWIVSLIRTWVPLAVGVGVTALARLGVTIDGATASALVTAVATGIYYALARALEQRWPKAGLLLGKAKAPTYDKAV